MFMRIKKILPFLILTIGLMLLFRTFIKTGIPDTHDGHSHVARIANYFLALRDGHFPVSWAPNLNYKYGYPVFQYHYQTPYFIAAFFYKLGFSLENSYKLTYVLAGFIAAFAMYFWLKNWLSSLAALAGGLLYVSAPPFLLQIFVRGAFGEFYGWTILPLLLLSIDKLVINLDKKSPNFIWMPISVITIALFVLSHIMLASFGLILVFMYGLLRMGKNMRKSASVMSKYIITYILGLGLSAFFWLPALAEAKFVNLAAVASGQPFLDHIIYFQQFIYSPWQYGYSLKGPKDTLSFMLGFAQIGIAVIVPIMAFFIFKKKKLQRLDDKAIFFLYFLLVGCIAVLLMSPLGIYFWKTFAFLKQLQFPWRLLVISSLGLAVWGAYVLDKFNNKILYLIVISICLSQIWFYAKPGKILHLSDYEYFEFPFTSSVNDETMPVDFDLNKNIGYTFQAQDLKQLAKITILDWKTQSHSYLVDSSSSAMIVERLAYMPGWETKVDTNLVLVNTHHDDFPGLPVFEVPAGKHTVITELTQHTVAKKSSIVISVISLLGLTGILLLNIVNKYGRKR